MRCLPLLLVISTFVCVAQPKSEYLLLAENVRLTNVAKSISLAHAAFSQSIKKADAYNACLAQLFLADAHRKLGYYEKATRYDSVALQFATQQTDTLLRQKAINNYCRNYVEGLQIPKAIAILTENTLLFNVHKTSETCKFLELKASCYFNRLRFDSAILTCREAIVIAQELQDSIAGMHLQMLLGKFYALKLQPDSIGLTYAALRYFERTKEYHHAAQAAGIIGLVLGSLNDTDEALFYYHKQRSFYKAEKNEQEAIQALLNIGDAYLVKKDMDAAKQAFYEGWRFYSKTKFKRGIIATNVRLARLFVVTEQFDSALLCLKTAQHINNDLKLTALNVIIHGLQFNLQSKMKNYASADSVAEVAVQEWSKNQDADLTKGMYKRLVEEQFLTPSEKKQSNRLIPTSQQNEYYNQSVIHTSKDYQKLQTFNWNTGNTSNNDSTYFKIKNEKVLRMDKEYKTDQLTDTIQKARNDVRATLENLHNNRLITGAVALLLLLVATGLWLQYKSRRRAERDRAQIEELQKEIHHRVTNNLGVINAMVEMAAKASASQLSMSTLKTRIDSVALVHRLLYSGTAVIGKISLQPYFEALSAAIAAIFEREIKVKITVDTPVETDSVLAEKLGLIVNELITNSFKYAFTGRENGTIHLYARQQAGELYLTVADNGSGLPEDAKKGQGSKLIKGLCHQLKGKYSYQNLSGAFFEMTVPG